MIYIWFTYDLLFNFHFLEGFLVSCLFLFFISWFILLIYTIDMLNYADMLCPIAQLLLLLSHCRWTLWRSLGSPAEVSPTCGSRRNISLLQVVCFPPYLAHMMCNIIYNRHISCLNLLDSSHMLNVCHIRLWMAYFGSKFFKPRNAKKCQDMPRYAKMPGPVVRLWQVQVWPPWLPDASGFGSCLAPDVRDAPTVSDSEAPTRRWSTTANRLRATTAAATAVTAPSHKKRRESSEAHRHQLAHSHKVLELWEPQNFSELLATHFISHHAISSNFPGVQSMRVQTYQTLQLSSAKTWSRKMTSAFHLYRTWSILDLEHLGAMIRMIMIWSELFKHV